MKAQEKQSGQIALKADESINAFGAFYIKKNRRLFPWQIYAANAFIREICAEELKTGRPAIGKAEAAIRLLQVVDSSSDHSESELLPWQKAAFQAFFHETPNGGQSVAENKVIVAKLLAEWLDEEEDPDACAIIPSSPRIPDPPPRQHPDSEKPEDIAEKLPAGSLGTQVGGGHYKNMAIQPVEYIYRNGLPFMEGAVVKYVSRHRVKGGREDIEKAIHFLLLLLELEYGEKAGG